MQEVSQDSFLSLQFIYSRFMLCKAAPLVPCHAAALIEGQGSVAQREREASRGQLCNRKAESKLIARYQGPLSPRCKTFFLLLFNTRKVLQGKLATLTLYHIGKMDGEYEQ